MRLILGSTSPRRFELLGQLGLRPDDVRAPDIDETPGLAERPRTYCLRMAVEKAHALAIKDGDVLLTADTTVALGRRILGKPEDGAEARAFLTQLSGRRHKVFTAIVVRTTECTRHRVNCTTVKMKRLSATDLDEYISTGDWVGKAGGYGIQGPAAAFLTWIQGSYSGVMGLPLAETAALLRSAGVEIWR